MAEARIDKWMWASRIFKTRTIAAEACKKGRVSINGSQVKPARTVKPGDVIEVRKPPITYSFKVLQAIEKRVGAKLIPEILEPDARPRKIAGNWKNLQLQSLWMILTLISILTLKRNRY